MKVNLDYKWGDEFYVRTDPSQQMRMLTGINIRPTGLLLILSLNGMEDSFFEFEVSVEENVGIRLGFKEEE